MIDSTTKDGVAVLAAEGVTDFDRYACQPGAEPQADLFVDHA